jgi:hypothetical protein
VTGARGGTREQDRRQFLVRLRLRMLHDLNLIGIDIMIYLFKQKSFPFYSVQWDYCIIVDLVDWSTPKNLSDDG